MAPGGYAWWYIDALSDDGRFGITLIAFVGSVFSPYYAWSRRRGRPERRDPPDPLNHCALNVALYGISGPSWSCTERGRGALARSPGTLSIGRSSLDWSGEGLTVEIDETTAPLPRRIVGRVRLHPTAVLPDVFDLDGSSRHRWHPLAPNARVEVEFREPSLRFRGHGYLDANHGDEPLEAAFSRWQWSRCAFPDGSTAILYDVTRRDGDDASLALLLDRDGFADRDLPPPVRLPRTGWRVERSTRADLPDSKVVRTLENGPFYARSLLETKLFGRASLAYHESLSLDRFRSPWVQAMLPFRMPRAIV